MSEILKLTIPGSPEYIRIAKMAVAQAASTEGLDVEKTEDLQVAVGEACRLISCHGYAAWSDTYNVIFQVEDEKITVVVNDETGNHSLAKNGFHQCVDCPNEGDIGIKLIECTMDEVEITRAEKGCRSIKLVKNLK